MMRKRIRLKLVEEAFNACFWQVCDPQDETLTTYDKMLIWNLHVMPIGKYE